MTDIKDTYQPKHMVDKDAVIDKWQAQAASAASVLDPSVQRGTDSQLWALLRCIAESRELNEILFDYGHAAEEDYIPKHLARRCSHVVTRPSAVNEPGRWVCSDCGEPDPHEGDLL